MAFERSEYLYYAALIAAATMFDSVLTIVLGAIIALISIHAIIVRTGADYERARVLRITGSVLLIALASLSLEPYAPALLVFSIITLIITAFEHVSVRGFIPVERV